MRYNRVVDGEPQIVQVFADGQEHVIVVDDKMTRVWFDPSRHTHYVMVRVGNATRTIASADIEVLVDHVIRIHRVYQQYDMRCRRLKEDAQRQRDRALHDIVVAHEAA